MLFSLQIYKIEASSQLKAQTLETQPNHYLTSPSISLPSAPPSGGERRGARGRRRGGRGRRRGARGQRTGAPPTPLPLFYLHSRHPFHSSTPTPLLPLFSSHSSPSSLFLQGLGVEGGEELGAGGGQGLGGGGGQVPLIRPVLD